jgi:hypothetical protein
MCVQYKGVPCTCYVESPAPVMWPPLRGNNPGILVPGNIHRQKRLGRRSSPLVLSSDIRVKEKKGCAATIGILIIIFRILAALASAYSVSGKILGKDKMIVLFRFGGLGSSGQSEIMSEDVSGITSKVTTHPCLQTWKGEPCRREPCRGELGLRAEDLSEVGFGITSEVDSRNLPELRAGPRTSETESSTVDYEASLQLHVCGRSVGPAL